MHAGCGRISNVVNGSLVVTDVTLGSTATYTCHIGYALRDSAGNLASSNVRHCTQEDGWSGLPLHCER